MLAVYTATVLVSAALLFFVQPMFARMVLPLFGGSPAVWNTALVFYQVTLLASYGYVHWATRRLSVRAQVLLHLILLIAAGTCLPVRLPQGWMPPTGQNPIVGLLVLLTLVLGLPLFVVSTTGPLIQKWFASTRHRLAPDPYFLYAASNIGSLAGLLSYPLFVEPHLRLADQSRLWGTGYGLLAVLTLVCASLVKRGRSPLLGLSIVPQPLADPDPEPVGNSSHPTLFLVGRGHALPAPTTDASRSTLTAGRRLRWVLLAFAPSSLMMGVTTHITTDVAAVPLLWVVPLALYLLSFVLVFARRPLLPRPLMLRALPLLVLPLLVVMAGHVAQPVLFIMGFHLLVFFVAAMVCHGELARDRPTAELLTEFYLWLAIGGALGGVFNALIAPAVFSSILEYPLALTLVCMLAPARHSTVASRLDRALDFVLPAAVAAAIVGVTMLLRANGAELTRWVVVLFVAGLTIPILSFARRPLRFGLAVGAILLVNPIKLDQHVRGLHSERSFFGLHRVQADPTGRFHLVYHGTTLHGAQQVRPHWSREPLGYYGRHGPLGDVFHAAERSGHLRSVAVAGLGAGTIASYAKPGQRWAFFEIDPVVERIARDPRFFSYLAGAPADLEVTLGDARLSLAASPEKFDLMVLDAYSSDAIPVHLLTREALRLYLNHLAPEGILVFHISNKHFQLAPVVARLAQDAGLLCKVRNSGQVSKSDLFDGLAPSLYAVVARRPEDFGILASDSNWKTARTAPDAALWTDDFCSLFGALRP